MTAPQDPPSGPDQPADVPQPAAPPVPPEQEGYSQPTYTQPVPQSPYPPQQYPQPGYQPTTPYQPPQYQQPGYPPPQYQQPGYAAPEYQQPYQPDAYQPDGYHSPSYPPQQYPQPGYAPDQYATQQYPPPPGYGQYRQYPPYSQGGYPQPAAGPAPVGRSRKPLLIVLGALVAAVAVVAVVIGFLTDWSFSGKTELNVKSVAAQVESGRFAAPDTNVTCNGGKNVEVKKGAHFTCTGDKNSYTVTITDGDGTYSIVQG